MSLCQYCRVHNEGSLIELGEKNYCTETAIWTLDELEEDGFFVPKDLYDGVCEHCYEHKQREEKNNE